MDNVLKLQMLPALGFDTLECASDISCNSDSSCKSNQSCVSAGSQVTTELAWAA